MPRLEALSDFNFFFWCVRRPRPGPWLTLLGCLLLALFAAMSHSHIFPLLVPLEPDMPTLWASSRSQCTPTELRQVRASVKSLSRLTAPTGDQFNHARHTFKPRASSQQRKVLASLLSKIRSYRAATLRGDGFPRHWSSKGYTESKRRTSPLSTWASCAWLSETSCRSVCAAPTSRHRRAVPSRSSPARPFLSLAGTLS